MSPVNDGCNGQWHFVTADSGHSVGGIGRYASPQEYKIPERPPNPAVHAHDKVKMHGFEDVSFLVETQGHFYHAFVKDFQFGLNPPLYHALAEILDGILRIFKYLVPSEVKCSAVQGCHFRIQFGRL